MTAMLDLQPAADAMKALLPGVTDDQLSTSTSCWTSVAGLLDHVVGLSMGFKMAAEKALGPDSPPPMASPEHLDPRWRQIIPAQLDELVGAWRDPSAAEGMAWIGGREFPAGLVAKIAVDELVLHGWDLAQATGQPYDIDDQSLQACLEFVSSVPNDPAARQGLFGPAVDVPTDAPLLDRVLALSGRNPAGPQAG